MFITFEGIDSSGKTTQARLLSDRLKEEGRECVFLREPGGTEISERIRSILLDRELLEMTQLAELFLFSSARTQLVSEVIRPAIEAKRIVVCDRFYDSTTAYQGYGRGLDLQAVETINRVASQGIVPDCTLILDIDLNEASRRRSSLRNSEDRMEVGGREFHEAVRQGYIAIARTEPQRCFVVSGTGPRQDIHEQIWTIVSKKLP